MKRWSPEDVALLKQQCEESRNGQPITPGNGIDLSSSFNQSISVKVGRAGRPVPSNVIALALTDNPDLRLELRIKKPRRRKRF